MMREEIKPPAKWWWILARLPLLSAALADNQATLFPNLWSSILSKESKVTIEILIPKEKLYVLVSSEVIDIKRDCDSDVNFEHVMTSLIRELTHI